MDELLTTKLFIPRTRSNLVFRPRLTERLRAGAERKLTLIAAPAGFGKTTLLSEWIQESTQNIAWLSLDKSDKDPNKFWTYFITALQHHYPQLGERPLALLHSTQAPPITSILTALINEVSAVPEEVIVVIDDYHLIDFQPINDALVFLVDHLPENLHLIVTTRSDPPLPLARLRAHHQLAELRAKDLRFTAGEAAAFLNQSMGLNLSQEEINTLDTRTEGWITGLQFAALSMKEHEDIPKFIRAFSGSHRHVLDYLGEEVLNQRPKGTLDFLLKTSILDRLSGPLCDAVTESTGGQAILENLVGANLFLTPLDEDGIWFRYHPLFAEVLKARLHRTHPHQLPELHRRAGNWFSGNGMLAEAIRHAIAGSDFEKACHLIVSVAGDLLRRGSTISLANWLDALPQETIRANPRLCLARAWTFFIGQGLNLQRAEEWSQLALQSASANGSLEADLIGETAALEAMIAATRMEVVHSRELANRALEHLPLDSPWRSAVSLCLGTMNINLGESTAAIQDFEEALRQSNDDGSLFVRLASTSFLGDTLVFQGNLKRALEMYEQALAWSEKGIPQKGTIMAYAGIAHILCEQDQLDSALAYINIGVDQVNLVGSAWVTHVLYCVLARVQQIRGNWQDALNTLNKIIDFSQKAKIDLVVKRTTALRACLQLAQGDLGAAEEWASNSGLSPDDDEVNHTGWAELEYLAFARIQNKLGNHHDAILLIDRLKLAAELQNRTGSLIAILILQSLIRYSEGKDALALESLERALVLAEPEGYIRIFLDEGVPMRELLKKLQIHLGQKTRILDETSLHRTSIYIEKLLKRSSRQMTNNTQKPVAILEPLSDRELEILQMLSAGLTNQEIANQLVIAVSTVKTHINHLYSKLGTHRRTHAIAVARDIGVLID